MAEAVLKFKVVRRNISMVIRLETGDWRLEIKDLRLETLVGLRLEAIDQRLENGGLSECIILI